METKCTENHMSCFNCDRWNVDCPVMDNIGGSGNSIEEGPFDEDGGLYS
ncbi:MAG: hypothetical protein KAS32_09080 [Candidatus Peribacteraceae bacterium]|nr:hypothetical protein [Candidatus Peribacteraceae bacterium]